MLGERQVGRMVFPLGMCELHKASDYSAQMEHEDRRPDGYFIPLPPCCLLSSLSSSGYDFMF